MSTWKVEVRFVGHQTVEVEAGSYDEACRAALRESDVSKADLTAYPENLVQQGEPWLRFGEWYDLHRPAPVMVFERAHGHTFEETDVTILRDRLGKIGLMVVDEWNGEGCNTVSFRCNGRRSDEQINEEERAALHAPRNQS